MKSWKIVIGLGLALSVLAAPATAGNVGFGPQAGFYDSDVEGSEGDWMFGAAIRARLNQLMGAEGSINYRKEDFEGGASLTMWPVMATGLIYPIPMIYGAAGAGWYNMKFEVEGVDLEDGSHQEFGWHFGGGLEVPVGTGATIAGDIRYVFLDYEFEDFPGANDTSEDFYVITVALLLGLN